MNIQEIKKQQEEANNKLFTECGLFWAFSNDQFVENKTPLKEGEKYVSIGGGGYLPKGNLNTFLKGMETNKKAYNKELKAKNLRLKKIAYEFANHECFYTGDWSVVADMFPDVNRDVVYKVFQKESLECEI